ncbi:hypothetical protein K2P97_02185 [bacterium]|nr:hypothetical protein [bacterium]
MKSFVFLTPEQHFSEVVKEACESRQIKTQPIVEVYLVQLLQHYLNSKNLHQPLATDSNEKPPETFAEMYLQAMNSEANRRKELMRVVADKTLYLTGFFADSLHRKTVDIEYYIDIGSAAYSNLYSWTKEDSLSHVYKTFSSRFMDFVEVLNYISEKSQVQADQNVLRLYDRYLRTGSELAREKLNELGVVTLPKEQLKLSKA